MSNVYERVPNFPMKKEKTFLIDSSMIRDIHSTDAFILEVHSHYLVIMVQLIAVDGWNRWSKTVL